MSQPIVYHGVTGLTVTAKIYSSGLDATISLTESPVSSGRYIASNADIAAALLAIGAYDVRFEDGSGNLLGDTLLRWSGTEEQLVLVSHQTYLVENETTGQTNNVNQTEA